MNLDNLGNRHMWSESDRAAVGPDTDEEYALEAQLPVFDLGDVSEFGRKTGYPPQRLAVRRPEEGEPRSI